MTIARQPFLYVNTLGERYANEDAPFGYTANQDIEQPGSIKWTIWDANWNTDKEKMHGVICENMHIPVFWNDKSYDQWKRKGVIVEANTIEELAARMNVPRDTFTATVKRSMSWSKRALTRISARTRRTTYIVKPPFGAAKVGTGLLVTLDGLRINTGPPGPGYGRQAHPRPLCRGQCVGRLFLQ